VTTRRRRELLREIQDVPHRGGPEGIDRLRVVADHAQTAPIRLHAEQDLRLQGVGVLVLVDQDMVEHDESFADALKVATYPGKTRRKPREKSDFDSTIRRFESSRPSQPVRVCRRSPVEALKPRRFPGFPVPIPNRRPRWQRCFGVIAPRRLCSRHLWFGLRARRRQVRQDDARHRRQTHFLRRHDAAVAGDYSTIRID
jgi:hypothetical protein